MKTGQIALIACLTIGMNTAKAAEAIVVPNKIVVAYLNIQLTEQQRQVFNPILVEAVQKVNKMRWLELQRLEFANEHRIYRRAKRVFSRYEEKLASMLTAKQQAPFQIYSGLVLETITRANQVPVEGLAGYIFYRPKSPIRDQSDGVTANPDPAEVDKNNATTN